MAGMCRDPRWPALWGILWGVAVTLTALPAPTRTQAQARALAAASQARAVPSTVKAVPRPTPFRGRPGLALAKKFPPAVPWNSRPMRPAPSAAPQRPAHRSAAVLAGVAAATALFAALWLGNRPIMGRPLAAPWHVLAAAATAVAAPDTLRGKTVVFVGKFRAGPSREELQRRAEAAGAVVRGSLSAKTDVLVTGADPPPAQLQRAEQLRVPIWSQAQFLDACAPPAVPTDSEEIRSEEPPPAPAPTATLVVPPAHQGSRSVNFHGRVMAFAGASVLPRHRLRFHAAQLGARLWAGTGGFDLLVLGKRPSHLLDVARTMGVEVVPEAAFVAALEEGRRSPMAEALEGRRVAFAGVFVVKLRVARQLAEGGGAQVVQVGSPGTDVLVCGHRAPKRDIELAMQLGCEVWTESDFLAVAARALSIEPVTEPTGLMNASGIDPDTLQD